VVLDLDDRESHGKPWNTYHIMQSVPDVVVYPQSQEEVVAVVKACARYKVCFSHIIVPDLQFCLICDSGLRLY
jgi:FAD/FMN-containing dehydrogenase